MANSEYVLKVKIKRMLLIGVLFQLRLNKLANWVLDHSLEIED